MLNTEGQIFANICFTAFCSDVNFQEITTVTNEVAPVLP